MQDTRSSATYDSRPATLSDLLACVSRRGDESTIHDGARVLNGTEFAALVADVAGGLALDGVGPGDAVAIRLPNNIDYLAAIFALGRLGAVAVHCNTRLGSVELQDVLARSDARLLLTRASFGPVDLDAATRDLDRAALPALRLVRDVGQVAAAAVSDAATPDAACLIYTSSGTTAVPKLVVHDQAGIAGHAVDVARATGLDRPGAAVLAAMPLCGTFGNVAVMAAIAGGARIVLLDVYEPARAAALIREHHVTHLFTDDRMIGALATLDTGGQVRFSAVAAFHPDASSSIARAIGAGLHPHSIYGSSEAQALFALAPQMDGEQVAVGPVNGLARLRYRDELGTVTATGEGELLLAGPSTFSHYHGDEERSAAARDPDGLFATGDLARGDGAAFRFRSRLGDVLRLGGFLVNPQEVETFLHDQPGVSAAQVVAVPHEGREVAVAFFIGDAAEAALLAACRASLARYKVPVRALPLAAFPTISGPNGVKIQRGRLRELAAAALATIPLETIA